jgi:hypothetical protein
MITSLEYMIFNIESVCFLMSFVIITTVIFSVNYDKHKKETIAFIFLIVLVYIIAFPILIKLLNPSMFQTCISCGG